MSAFNKLISIFETCVVIYTISEVIVGAEVVVIGVPTGVGAKEGGEADSGKWQMSSDITVIAN